MSAYNAFMVKIHELNTENAQLRAEIAKLRAERENLLALLKAAREHREWCNGDSVTRDLGPPLDRCREIETP